MTVQGTVAPAVGRPATKRVNRWWIARTVLLVAVLVIVAAGWFGGARQASYNSLRGDIAAGRTDRVEITGGLPVGAQGTAMVTFRWRAGGYWHVADATEASGPDATSGMSTTSDTPTVLYGEVASQLQAIAPHRDLQVVRTGSEISGYSQIAGWRVPDWAIPVAILIWLAVIVILVNGPEPRFATRWAWFWLLICPLSPLSIVAFLVLSRSLRPTDGSTGPVGRRLTGGWAFLLAFVVLGGVTLRL